MDEIYANFTKRLRNFLLSPYDILNYSLLAMTLADNKQRSEYMRYVTLVASAFITVSIVETIYFLDPWRLSYAIGGLLSCIVGLKLKGLTITDRLNDSKLTRFTQKTDEYFMEE